MVWMASFCFFSEAFRWCFGKGIHEAYFSRIAPFSYLRIPYPPASLSRLYLSLSLDLDTKGLP